MDVWIIVGTVAAFITACTGFFSLLGNIKKNVDKKIFNLSEKIDEVIEKIDEYEKEVEKIYLRKETFFEIEKRWTSVFNNIMDKQDKIETKVDNLINTINSYLVKGGK